MTRRREESVNTAFAFLLNQLGVGAEPESITPEGRPDVIFSFRGLRIAIEGKFADVQNAREIVLDDACGRINRGLAHISVAAIYPEKLRTVPFASLMQTLASISIEYQILSEAGETAWMTGTPESILASIRRAQQTLAQDDIVEKAAEGLSAKLDRISKLWGEQAATCDRLSKCLGISIPKDEEAEKRSARRETAAKVSALIVANALIFQEQLRDVEGIGTEIVGVSELENASDAISIAKKQWRWIWTTIDYVPIFQLAEHVLNILPPHPSTKAAFTMLLDSVRDICSNQAALRHDLMGRIYHWLLHDAKYLGTYYTSGSAATLLLSLTMRADWGDVDFGDLQSCTKLKIADLTCGTGTLLMASTQAITDAYIRSRVKAGVPLNEADLDTLHKALIEDVLHGYDVLPAAVHLTASTLAMLSPSAAFKRMNLHVMPIGVDHATPRLGSLDFLSDARIETQIALDNTQLELTKINPQGEEHSGTVLPKLDLCVMNPPFVRSVGGNLLFGSLDEDEREELQTELKKRVKKVKASITAGLGSVFVAIADKHLKENGRLAFVLPAALTSGEAWGETRALISEKYHLEAVVSSFDPGRQNFSENTSLSEILFIARKLTAGELLKKDSRIDSKKEKKGKATAPLVVSTNVELNRKTLYVNLWKNPRSIHEALDIADRIARIRSGSGVVTVDPEEMKFGEVFELSSPKAKSNWLGAMFAQERAVRALADLEQCRLALPNLDVPLQISLTPLSSLGGLGFDRRDIFDAFAPTAKDRGEYAAFWGHESSEVRSVAQRPNAGLSPLKAARSGRKIKKAGSIWAKAGDIFLAERIRTNTHRVLAIHLSEQALGNTWWAFKSDLTAKQKKALTLWLNSTPSLLLVLGRKVVTEGAFMQMKKPAWASMPVLDVRKLTQDQLNQLAADYDRIAKMELLALSQLEKDPTRKAIDEALSKALSLPDLSVLREMIAREPSLVGAPSKKNQIADGQGQTDDPEVSSDEIRKVKGKVLALKSKISEVEKRQQSSKRPAKRLKVKG